MRLFDLSHHQLSDVLSLVTAEDKVLLRQEAAYLMKTNQLNQLPCAVYCLVTDAAVRGLVISEPFTALNDSQWLELVLQAEQQL
ncbi:DsrH/TusB family sulfur metabolism protein [Rheinheimera sp. 1928-s]|uniref:DsrH/TusB family sulfur metabolism protein n=1 Tax=Rheinheimera sp. 1928-s TaxID=3033803 RepID=UPI00260F8E26|nr:DsrH/TusB family sulfur metabolism protein [Rheinheimera sp. 1928-s]MDF3126644.1 DsrH/TusB family sulfur metabolism protein [Rheinheimera sp. 1928-s]